MKLSSSYKQETLPVCPVLAISAIVIANVYGSDFTDQQQLLFFQPERDYSLLKRMLLARFDGETVSVEEIDRYVLEETPFRVAGYKEKVLVPMEDASEIRIIAGGMKRRRHTYPEGVRIHFAQGPQVSLWG